MLNPCCAAFRRRSIFKHQEHVSRAQQTVESNAHAAPGEHVNLRTVGQCLES